MLKKCFLLIALFAAPLVAQAQTRCESVTGAWTVTEVQLKDAPTATKPIASLWLFTDTHYSITVVNAPQPRSSTPPLKTPGQPTDAEKLALYEHWQPVTAQAGTYQLNNGTLIVMPTVAKNQGVMNGGRNTRQCTMEGGTMVVVESDGIRRKLTRTK